MENKIREAIRDVADFPKPGILFKDITPIFSDPDLCKQIAGRLGDLVRPLQPEGIAGIESRGFLFGILIAQYLEIPFLPIRKAGKLPGEVISQEYDLEYGSAKIEIPIHAVKKGMRIHVHDDLLATGGTAIASSELIRKAGGRPTGYSFLVELEGLKGRSFLERQHDTIISLIKF